MSNPMDLDEFLQQSKKASLNLKDYDTVRVVMGNRTCDLDSAVCALVQGYIEYFNLKYNEIEFNKLPIIPLMNIPRREYHIKTEVVHVFKQYRICPDLLTFRDEIDLKAMTDKFSAITLEVVLVDHHAIPKEDSFLMDYVIRVIDHRPQDEYWQWSQTNADFYLENVGSCATLVAKRFLDLDLTCSDCRIGHLLRGPILIDTCNLSEETKRTTPVDIEMLEQLEYLSEHMVTDYQLEDRNTVYRRLIQARNDISSLSLDDLLIRDLKVVDKRWSPTFRGVPIVQMPLLVRKFIAAEPRPIPFDAICNFAVARNTRKVVLCGMMIESDQIRREFALFSLSSNSNSQGFDLADNASIRSSAIFELMLSKFYLAEPSLDLRNEETLMDNNGKWEMFIADQTNLTITRKQIMPIVWNIIKDVPDFESNNQSRPKWAEKPGCSSSS